MKQLLLRFAQGKNIDGPKKFQNKTILIGSWMPASILRQKAPLVCPKSFCKLFKGFKNSNVFFHNNLFKRCQCPHSGPTNKRIKKDNAFEKCHIKYVQDDDFQQVGGELPEISKHSGRLETRMMKKYFDPDRKKLVIQ